VRFLFHGSLLCPPVAAVSGKVVGNRDGPTATRSPWQNGSVERLIGSMRREVLDHVITIGRRHLRRLLRGYADYYNAWPPPFGLEKNMALSSPVGHRGAITTLPKLGAIHYAYVRT
jgi:hypothetical protein